MKTEALRELLGKLPDPEIPVITIEELGILREVSADKDGVLVKITPTYSGCPAMKQIEDDIGTMLREAGVHNFKVEMVYDPPWTTDWISESAKEKLREYGIAPPEKSTPDKSALSINSKKIPCPRCKSENTEMISQFGSTACKALHRCLDCLEPFDYFKCL
jgi:ring-1,2-phenylacetyl-CoA epoxidase subunit PaaD